MKTEEITKYYDYTLPFYRFFWYRGGGSRGIHYGLWEEGIDSLQEALINTNKFMADKAGVSAQDEVLDAGCGVGGSVIWLAKNYGCETTGITVSKEQVEEANNLAAEEGVEDLVEFKVNDFMDTNFEDEGFDVVWAIESICYAERKIDFLREVFRLLKEGGRIIIADGFLAREPQSEEEETILREFCEGFALPGLEYFERFKEDLRGVGFDNIEGLKKNEQIMPTARRMYGMSLLAYPISILTEKLGLTSPLITKHALTGLRQYRAFKDNLFNYGIFYAEK